MPRVWVLQRSMLEGSCVQDPSPSLQPTNSSRCTCCCECITVSLYVQAWTCHTAMTANNKCCLPRAQAQHVSQFMQGVMADIEAACEVSQGGGGGGGAGGPPRYISAGHQCPRGSTSTYPDTCVTAHVVLPVMLQRCIERYCVKSAWRTPPVQQHTDHS
jgi:hypothetical protein